MDFREEQSRKSLEMPQTLYDKIWSDHVVEEEPDGTCLLYVDRHIIHEVDSPQAFGGLRRAGLTVKAREKTLLVVDHNVPTLDRTEPNPDPESAAQIAYFAENAEMFGLEYYDELARACRHLSQARAQTR
jgi:3-isopropylmalate/(R)-2-methylmalate dehydratase large subunit